MEQVVLASNRPICHKVQQHVTSTCVTGTEPLALLKDQICMISFQTCTQIFGIHKALVHIKRYNCSRQRDVCCMYEYIIETPLTELKTFPNCKET